MNNEQLTIELHPVAIEEREILANLLEKYNYEFSQWDLRDVNGLGLYGYKYLDCYWLEERRFAYFIRADDKLAGFVMVNDFAEAPDRATDFSVAEFFVMHKYRRAGVGSFAAKAVFDLHRGRWQLKYHPKNTGSAIFWPRVVGEYTNGQYELARAYPGTEYEDGTPGDILFFENNGGAPE
ncbi:MAG: GNAT family N-acetyltransferase [Oscillospiraceae bacterium]|nr:GNAT family N-acetyltransferase [Oscillospiraceae bacterium]